MKSKLISNDMCSVYADWLKELPVDRDFKNVLFLR